MQDENKLGAINNKVKPIVGKTGMALEGGRGAVGLDYYDLTRLTPEQQAEIAIVISLETNTTPPIVSVPIASEPEGTTVPAALALNKESVTTLTAAARSGATVTVTMPQDVPAANVLVGLGLLSDEAQRKSDTAYDLNETNLEAAFFTNDYVTAKAGDFEKKFNAEIAKDTNRIAVIVSNSDDPEEKAIITALQTKNLLTYLGTKIFIIAVRPGSPADTAFKNFIGAEVFTASYQKATDLLNNPQAVKGFNGAV